jgi:hypothetical protein
MKNHFIENNMVRGLMLGVVVLAIFFGTVPSTGTIFWPGLDNSYALAFNYFFASGVQIGKDILFTYGPLGFLEWPQPQGNNLLYANVIYSSVHLASISALLWLGMVGRSFRGQIGVIALVLFLSCLLSAFMYLKLVFLIATLLLLHFATKHAWLFAVAVSLVVLAILIRSTYGILSLLMLFSYSFYIAYVQREPKFMIGAVMGLFTITIAAWLVIYGNFSGLLSYIRGILEFSSGNSSAMTLNPQNNWLVLTIFVCLVLYLPFSVDQKEARVAYVILGLSVVAFLKYAFSREGWSLNYGFVYILVAFSLFVLFVPKLRMKHYVIILTALALFSVNMEKVGGFNPFGYIKTQIKSNFENRNSVDIVKALINYENQAQILLAESVKRLEPQILSEQIRTVIGKSTVDAYPYEISYVMANGFNWSPRPVIQSYISYTPYLDRQNALFFQTEKAPNYLLWEAPQGDIKANSIDTRYVMNDEPLAIFEILGRYSILALDGKVVILKKNGQQGFMLPQNIGEHFSQWGQWIEVSRPPACAVLRSHLDFSRTLVGKLKRAIYKEEEFYVEYKLENGNIQKHRLVIDNAISGVWVSPYIANIWKREMFQVKEIRFSHSTADFLNDHLRLEWECIRGKEGYSLFQPVTIDKMP